MAFSAYEAEQAWKKAGGKCECQRPTHGHEGRCNRTLILANRGRQAADGAWEARRISEAGGDVLANCRIFCWDCHKQSF